MAKATFSARLAADIGGTFTDIVLEQGDRRFTAKVLTTPHAPEAAVVEGTHAVLGSRPGSASPTSTWSFTARRWPPTR